MPGSLTGYGALGAHRSHLEGPMPMSCRLRALAVLLVGSLTVLLAAGPSAATTTDEPPYAVVSTGHPDAQSTYLGSPGEQWLVAFAVAAVVAAGVVVRRALRA